MEDRSRDLLALDHALTSNIKEKSLESAPVEKKNGINLETENFNIDTNPLDNKCENNKSKNVLRVDVTKYEEASNLCPLSALEDQDQKLTNIEEHSEVSSYRPGGITLSRYASTYELKKFSKNALLIINHEDIDDAPRIGTHVDVAALTHTFEKFGFEVKENVHNDLKKREIIAKVEEFTSRDFTEYGCVGIVILTHGSNYGRLRAKDRIYCETEIIDLLKRDNRTLLTKPKIVIIQACRGTNIRPPVPVFLPGTMSSDREKDLETYHLPLEADMLVLHSSYVGSPAFRHPDYGSWFIQTLCEAIDQLAPAYDLETIVTEVKRRVAIDKYQQERDNIPDEYQMCQMPVVTSTLMRKLYLSKCGIASRRDSLPSINYNNRRPLACSCCVL